MVLKPEATSVSARSLAPVKSSATDPRRRGITVFWLELEFEAFIANIIVNDSIEAALVAREAKAVGAGSVKTRGPGFHDLL